MNGNYPPLYILEEMEKSKKSNLGESIELTENVEYICPSDGYFNLTCNYESGSITEGYVNDIKLIIMSAPTSTPMREYQYASLFVKAGMRIRIFGGWGRFYPII